MKMKMKQLTKIVIILFLFLTPFYTHAKIEELNLNSDTGCYKKINNQKVFVAQGNAHIIIDDNEVYCDEIEIYLTDDENVEKTIFKKNIIIFQENDQIQIGGEYAEYYKKEKQFIIRENAFYIDVEEEVAVFGDSIYNYEKEDVAIIQGNVRIYQKDIISKGAFVKYTKKDKLMEISGFPTIDNQGSEYNAKKIIIDIENNTFSLEGGVDAKILNEVVEDEIPKQIETALFEKEILNKIENKDDKKNIIVSYIKDNNSYILNNGLSDDDKKKIKDILISIGYIK